MSQIYLMYALWVVTGIVLLAYIAYRRKRKNSVPAVVAVKG
jgi:uncharacterized membrane protein affecting hemolysin expression